MAKIEGDYPDLERVPTGLWGFDRAIGDPHVRSWGLPLRSLMELFGPPESGKTTFGLYLATKIREDGRVLLAQLERVDKKYVERVTKLYPGIMEFVSLQKAKGGKLMTHSEIMTDAVNRLGNDEEIVALILDSIASVRPPLRDDQPIGTGYQTDLARFMSDAAPRIDSKLLNRETPAVFIALNHVGVSLDPGNKSHVTKGGKAMKFLGALRVYLYRKEAWPKSTEARPNRPIKGFLVAGNVEKLRFGGKGRKFKVYMSMGCGVHPGMTAMWDCIDQKLATKAADDQGYVSIDSKRVGRIGQLVDDADKGKDVFQDFQALLADHVDPELEAMADDVVEAAKPRRKKA